MENSLVKVSSNWCHVGGCTPSECVKECVADPDFFIRPQLNELVDEEKSVLLSKEQSSEPCELYFKLFGYYKIQAVSFACNVVKVEVFQGPVMEYLETIYGVVLDEQDDQFKSYRYDVEIEKSGITDLTLRFLTDSKDVCIFGLMLHIAPNPNGITTILPNVGCANIENTSNASSKPDKFNKLLENMKKSNQCDFLTVDQLGKKDLNKVNQERDKTPAKADEDIFTLLKLHIDERIQEMDLRLNKYLKDMEKRQNEKLDEIINALERINK